MTIPCPRCDEPATVADCAEAAVQSGDATVRVQGLARATCPAGHVTMLPPDAAAHANAKVDEMLLVSTTRGLVRRREVCGACEGTLALPPRNSDRPVSLDVDGRVLTVIVESPMVRCPDCGREQLPLHVGAALPDLLTAAVAQAAAAGT